jgi:hypothetical protein
MHHLTHNDHELVWSTPHRAHSPRSTDFYWIVGTIAFAVALIAGYFNNFLFAIIALIAAFIIMVESGKAKDSEKVMIVNKGVRVGNTLYPVSTIHSFAIDEESSEPHLSLKLNKPFVPTIKIPLGDMEAAPLRDFLSKHIPEEDHPEEFAEVLAKSLGL